MTRKPAVFLDRDGTILTERGYLTDVNKMAFYSFAFTGMRRLMKAGYKLVLITNQSGVGRGYLTLDELDAIHRAFKQKLRANGVTLSGIYFCPHRPDDNCRCRKPKPYLVRKAARELHLDLKKSFVIGDQARDVELANRSGARGILVLTGAGRSHARAVRKTAATVARNLKTAADWIAAHS